MRQYFFFIALVVALVLGFSNALDLDEVAQNGLVRGTIVAAILFLTAVTIDFRDFGKLLQRPLAVLLAFVLSFVCVPLLAVLIGGMLDADSRLGLLVMAAAPATMSSATVWTGRANGNQAMSLAISMLTNSSCFLLTPLCLAWLADLPEGATIEVPSLMRNLLVLVIIPIVIAQVVRRHQKVPALCKQWRALIGNAVQLGVLIMALFGATVTGLRMQANANSMTLVSVASVVLGVILLRLIGLGCGVACTRLIKLEPTDRTAVTIAGTQKTLVVGLEVGTDLGCSILPIIGYHIAQLTIDTLFAGWVRKRAKRE